jgi:prenylcysteine oxidase/farnesylcysteine lyase
MTKNIFFPLKLIFFLLFFTILISTPGVHLTKNKSSVKIAVIGSGIGGASASYYLLNLAKTENITNLDINVDLYEKSSRVGGRVYSEKIEGDFQNIGASFFIQENELIYTLIKNLSVPYHEAMSDDDQSVGLYNNRTIIFELGNNNILNLIKIIWRYGFSPLSAKWDLNKNLQKFLRIYRHIVDDKKIFKSLEEFLDLIDLKERITQSVEEYLLSMGISQTYINEILNGFISSIYNQNKEINSFAGFVTLAGISYKPFEIVGGNKVLVDSIVKNLNQNFPDNFKLKLNTPVDKISKIVNNDNETRFILNNNNNFNDGYDYVIIACPIMKTNIKFDETFPDILLSDLMPVLFQENYKFYIKGEVNPEYFTGLTNTTVLPHILLSVDKVNSNGLTEIIKIKEGLFVTQSTRNLTEAELDEIFLPGKEVVFHHAWDFAYPQIVPMDKSATLPRFEISKNVFHLNAIELAASCMEMSMISAKNAVNIIEKSIRGEFDQDEGELVSGNDGLDGEKKEKTVKTEDM